MISVALGAAALLPAVSRGLAEAARLPTLDACGLGKPELRPAQITIACGDGNFFVTALRWSNWTQTSANGHGVGHLNDCRPYCAAGKFHTYPVAVRLSRPEICHGSVREFTRLTVQFVAVKPSSVARVQRFDAGRQCP